MSTPSISRARLGLRLFFAAVWLVNGLWCKLLDQVPRHGEIVARILGPEHARTWLVLIGGAEMAMAAWILSGWRAQLSAWAQIAAVLAMNVLEFFLTPDLLLFGRGNALVALAYVGLVAWTEGLTGRK